MRRISAIIILLFMWLPETGQAAEKCDVINALERIQFAQLRLAQVSHFSNQHPDALLLADHLLRLDRENIKNAVQSIGTETEIAILQEFHANALVLNAAITADQRSTVAAYFASKIFRDAQIQIRTILPRFRCNIAMFKGEQGTSRQGQSTSKVVKSDVKLGIQGNIWWLLGTITTCVVAGVAVFKYRINSRLRKRRAKRYPTHIKTLLRQGDLVMDATTFDISGKGAKLMINGKVDQSIGAPVQLLLHDNWHEAHISWQNTHYCGISFLTPLRHQTVNSLRKFTPANGTQKTKTAPV